ncbi:MAG: hypothetical protein A2W18_11080 [Candidatus Muproteobacteria bacterium RBG_16_60_9]|uniref:Uncharacterized protein n=1 Tax=Candidatus Muproteobacteria bacterium RBG_16_60_9 TaxID=1817755 RepID=A0A1F6UZ67_9PROT|nr:MAG: hypothetical protein A2W18_11080 [Candidatus Muproteobacteria bacterium RBG_16_60_9]
MMERAVSNRCRYLEADPGGHYESYFQRANHPERPHAFWIRYTVFCPKGRPGDAAGELWAIYFDGERERVLGILFYRRVDVTPLGGGVGLCV